MSRVYSDPISEKYRKYIIKVKITIQNSYYLLWGTNLENEEEDYLMLDSNDNIVAFSRIKNLVAYVKKAKELPDPFNTEKWANEYKRNRTYASYDLTFIKTFLNEINVLKEFDEDNAMDLIGFMNLFSDYAYQLNHIYLLRLYKEDNVEILRDYLHLIFFWKTPEESYVSELNNRIRNLDFLKAKEIVKEMISIFEHKLIVPVICSVH